MDASENQITQLLHRWNAGDIGALDTLLPQVYGELRMLAAHELRQHAHHDTLQPTALVNEVFARLLGGGKVDIANRKHLYVTAAKLMRQTLTDRARAQLRDKRGGGPWRQVEFTQALALPIELDTDLIALDKAIAALAQLDPHLAQIVELRYFVGLEVAEIAHLFGVDERTVYREWAMARTWLRQRIE